MVARRSGTDRLGAPSFAAVDVSWRCQVMVQWSALRQTAPLPRAAPDHALATATHPGYSWMSAEQLWHWAGIQSLIGPVGPAPPDMPTGTPPQRSAGPPAVFLPPGQYEATGLHGLAAVRTGRGGASLLMRRTLGEQPPHPEATWSGAPPWACVRPTRGDGPWPRLRLSPVCIGVVRQSGAHRPTRRCRRTRLRCTHD
jgi:hypothetical protein